MKFALIVTHDRETKTISGLSIELQESLVTWNGEAVRSDDEVPGKALKTLNKVTSVLICHRFELASEFNDMKDILGRLKKVPSDQAKKVGKGRRPPAGNPALKWLFGVKSNGVGRFVDVFVIGRDKIRINHKNLPRENVQFVIREEQETVYGSASNEVLKAILSGIDAKSGVFTPQPFDGPLTIPEKSPAPVPVRETSDKPAITPPSFEDIILTHAQRARADWSSMLDGTSHEDHKLETHVEPRLSVELRPEEVRARRQSLEQQGKKGDDQHPLEQLQFEELPTGLDQFRQRYIDGEWNWILITERAGGGKTVLSWQLRDMLSSGDRPFFVVRYENIWPANLRTALERAIQPDCSKEINPAEVVDWLIENQRIVVIFDALDQVSKETTQLLTRIQNDPDDPAISSRSIRVIVTSRPEAVNSWPGGFDKTFWRHFHLEEFDKQQRESYVIRAVVPLVFALPTHHSHLVEELRIRTSVKTARRTALSWLIGEMNTYRGKGHAFTNSGRKSRPNRPIRTWFLSRIIFVKSG